jgi:hypothetical protein
VDLARKQMAYLLGLLAVTWGLIIFTFWDSSVDQWSIARPLYAQQAATATVITTTAAPSATNAISVTSVSTKTTATKETHPPVWVTPTAPAADLFAAATLSIQMTADAATTGTATPLPAHWKVAAVRLLPYVPAPQNTATAEALALEATARAVTTGEPVGVVFWTATPRPTATATATPVATNTPIIVTATFTPEDVLAAATIAAQATVDATTTGTATPLPANLVLATPTPKPIIVTNTPTPANEATAMRLAAVETAIAFTTGVPDQRRYITATPTEAEAAVAARPSHTPTPLFIAIDALTATPTADATPLFPSLLVGKILFLADNDGRRGAEAYAMDPDGSNVVRLSSLEFYQRALNRESYSADRRYQTLVKKGGRGQQQIFYQDTLYNTEHSLTQFGAGDAWDPRWSPTAESVVFVANEAGNDEIWLVRKGEWPAQQLTQNQWEWDKHPSWSPDGTQIVFMSNRSGSRQLWLMANNGDKQQQLTNFTFEVWEPVWVKYSDN